MATIFTESFETDGNGSRYTTSIPEFTDGSSDFLTRTDGSNISGGYDVTGSDGSFYFAAQDIDGEGDASQQTLIFSEIDIANFTNLSFSALFAEDDSSDGNEDWDAPDFVTVEYQVDGGGFLDLLAFENDGSTFNSAPLQDTDFDGTGDGTEVTDTFATFSNTIDATGSTLDLRITFDLDSGDEDIAIDNIQLMGDAATSELLISEFQPNPPGTDPSSQTFELSGTPGESFSGVIVGIESDSGSANPGDINNFESVSGTFDANGLLTVSIDDLENPSFTVALLSDFTGDTSTDIDPDDDGMADDLSTFGTVFDAIGVLDAMSDQSLLYGAQLGGTDFDFTGSEPEIIFRDASVGALFAVNELGVNEVFDTAGNSVDPNSFDINPTTGTTFGAINPSSDNGGTTLSIQASDAVQAEGDSGTTSFTFTVTRSGDTSGATDVDFAVSGEADAADFGGTLPSGTISFAAGDTTQTITLAVSGDTDTEADEDFTVTLSNPTNGATIATATATGTIQNDDITVTPIFEIQGAAQSSPLAGQSVSTIGIVTAVDTNGFYLQDPTGDGDSATSDALFVFTSSAPGVSVGDELQVSGTVSEFIPGGAGTGNLSITQISGSPTITTLSTGNALPNSVVLGVDRTPPTEIIDNDQDTQYNVLQGGGDYEPTADGIDFYESLEAMRVTVNEPVAVAGTSQFGEIFTVVNDGAGASNLSQRGTANIAPEDYNPERVQIDSDSFTPGGIPDVATGAELNNVTGVISYSFGSFEVLATEAITVTESNLEPEISTIAPTATNLTIATYNVLNLDPNDNDGDMDVANGRFEAIANDIVTNLNTPDVIGLQEVQDNDGSDNTGVTSASETLQLLVDEIAAAGGPQYEFIDNTFIEDGESGGQPGGNIRTAFLYNPNRVNLVDGSVRPIGDQEPGSPFNGSRLPLVADFEFNGQTVTVVDNHFSSKGGSSPLFGAIQPASDLQEDPDINGSLDERREQAQAVNDFVDGILANDADANVVVVGDLNEFEFISPLDILAGTTVSTNGGQETAPGGEAVLTNLVNTISEEERYSFIFQGNSQQIDHILVSDSLLEGAVIDNVHVNTEFAATDERASDHDPVIASLSLESDRTVNEINGTRGDDTITGTNEDDLIRGDNGNDIVNARGGNDTVIGGRGGDSLRGGAGDDVLAADRVDRFDDFDGTTSFLSGDSGNDTIFGGRKDDTIGGGNDDDVLFGKGGDDLIRGGSGDDLLNGGVGNDTLRGQGGIDTADYSDLTFNGVFASVAGLDVNLSDNSARHSSTNNALTWEDTLTTIENIIGTSRNDRSIGNGQNNVFDGQGEVGRSDRQTQFTALNGETYSVTADVVEYSGSQSDLTFMGSADSFTVMGSGIGTDTLIDIEFVRFNADSAVVATSDLAFA
ncbi:MAG: endonuclease/exonuclease/phosphatase family protein [Cyanophyceae cyanobacterium]